MSPRLGYRSLPCLLGMLLPLAGCSGSAGIPSVSLPGPSAQHPDQQRNASSFLAQLYGNEADPFNGTPGPRPVLRVKGHRISFKHHNPRT